MKKFRIPLLALIFSMVLGTGQTVKATNADGISKVGLPKAPWATATMIMPSDSLVDPSSAPLAQAPVRDRTPTTWAATPIAEATAMASTDRPIELNMPPAATVADQPPVAVAAAPSAMSKMTTAPIDMVPRRANAGGDVSFTTPDDRATPASLATSSPDVLPQEATLLKSEAISVAIAAQPLPENPDVLFNGGADSIVTRTVGHAEGTRTADGQKTLAYSGHVDPGNAHWNIGSFSYQHCDKTCTPEVADDRQLARLRRQTTVIQQRAAANNITLTLEEALNGIDLANQAPLAALEPGGYVDQLKIARQRGHTGSDAVLYARTWSFRNPQTQAWDAPGLGNRYESISHDQDRRLSAIAQALDRITQQSAQPIL